MCEKRSQESRSKQAKKVVSSRKESRQASGKDVVKKYARKRTRI